MEKLGMRGITTTSLSGGEAHEALARQWADELGVPFSARNGETLAEMTRRHQSEWVLVAGSRPTVHTPQGDWFYHPGLAVMRMKRILAGEDDPLKAVCGLNPGDRVLDCTLGLASDAIVLSHYVGVQGEVCGIEQNPLIALLTAYGLQNYNTEIEEMNRAMRRIKVIRKTHAEILAKIPDQTFDVVYFDPMFRRSVEASPGIRFVKAFGHADPIEPAAVVEAVRVARKRVVLKERRGSREFARLGFCVYPRKSGSFTYGVIDVSK